MTVKVLIELKKGSSFTTLGVDPGSPAIPMQIQSYLLGSIPATDAFRMRAKNEWLTVLPGAKPGQ